MDFADGVGETTALHIDFEEDLQYVAYDFSISGHPTTVLRFCLVQVNLLATHLPTDGDEPLFKGFHQQVMMCLQGHAQHYLQSIKLVEGFPLFKIVESGLTPVKYLAYLENYLKAMSGKPIRNYSH